jgi:hypothetical protein
MNDTFTKTNLPAVIPDQPGNSGQAPHAEVHRDQAFEAQVLGQGGQKRGLRGGQPVLDAARAAYLDAEWRGGDDRRLPAGTLRAVTL